MSLNVEEYIRVQEDRLVRMKSIILSISTTMHVIGKLWQPFAKRGLLSELAPLLSRGSVSRKDFNFPLGIEKAGTPPRHSSTFY